MTPKEYKEMMAHLTRPSRIKVAQLDNVNTPDLDQTPDSILRPGETLEDFDVTFRRPNACLLYTSPSPRDGLLSRMPSSA